eukprot:TRINITY_DN1789_c0_g1_i11.p1 TRINITY_DN1789_c0_g1~~TRINITY_DN1789_c0_g1_i11.p1  ORF type:complete len:1967 (+),score=353.98 TRINITY_DN1789_c0_g1_i11:165-6065(+)
MGTTKSPFYAIFCMVKSWIRRSSNSSYSSRSFWMPDASCTLCYECESPFTIFNRRHHCRVCGRVFCGKCTTNTIPSSSVHGWTPEHEGERIRVCMYCYNSWEEQEAMSSRYDENQSSCGISPSASATSLESSNVASSDSSKENNLSAMPFSTVPYHHISYNPPHSNHNSSSDNFSDTSPLHSDGMERQLQTARPQNISIQRKGLSHFQSIGNTSVSMVNQSDDEDEAPYNSGDGHSTFDLFPEYGKEPQVIDAGTKVVSQNNERPAGGASEEPGSSDDDEPLLFNTRGEDPKSFDIVNNSEVFIPPEAEHKEDEKETSVFEDDDFEDNRWVLPSSKDSFSDTEGKSKDKSGEEYQRAMSNLVRHFRALVCQLLKGENIPLGEDNPSESWLEIVASLSWVAANYFRPDTSKGGGMDPGGYVKVKCVASGRPSESEVIRGIVCTKNVADRRMATECKNARLLLLGGALEYQRQANQLSSMDTLLQQEMEHLKMTVNKIEVHRPNVLLVEKTVSGYARKSLQAKQITFVLNVKRPLLERIARCTGAQVVPSIDNLATAKVGHCENFQVKRFLEEHGSAGQNGKKLARTLMFFDGCPTRLGCTVLLKGANGDILKKIKRVVQYAVFAAYHLALETSFLADEGATLTGLPIKPPAAFPDKRSCLERSISVIHGFSSPSFENDHFVTSDSQQTSYSALSSKNALNLNGRASQHLQVSEDQGFPLAVKLSNAQFNSDCRNNRVPPTNGSNLLETRSPGFSSIGELYSSNTGGYAFSPDACSQNPLSDLLSSRRQEFGFTKSQENIKPNEVCSCLGSNERRSDLLTKNDTLIKSAEAQETSCKKDAKYLTVSDQKLVSCGSQEIRSCTGQETAQEEFPASPSDQQSILVILSTRSLWKGTVCERARLLRIKYYGNFDKPLGRFLRDDLFDQSYRCSFCDSPPEAHVHCYTHKHGSLTIVVKRLETNLPGEKEGKIWMWHLCQICARKTKVLQPTRRVVMSDAAWGLSFGKFLELSFSNHAAASRASTCGHSLHRDCLRFYGFGRMVACFQYLPIHVHSVHLPPPVLEFNGPNQQEWLKNEASEVADKAELFFAEAFDSLRQVGEKTANSGSLYAGVRVPELRKRVAELEGKLQKEKSEFEGMLQRSITKDCKPGQPYADILELNRLRRQIVFSSFIWDRCLRDLDSSLKLKRSSVSLDSSLVDERVSQVNRNPSFRERASDALGAGKDGNHSCRSGSPNAEGGNSPLNTDGMNTLNSSICLNLESVPTDSTLTAVHPFPTNPTTAPFAQDYSSEGCGGGVEDTDNKACGETDALPYNEGSQVASMEIDHSDSNEILKNAKGQSANENAVKHTHTKMFTEVRGDRQYCETSDVQNKLDNAEGNGGGLRTLCDGNLPIVPDLSLTLDAVWTGKGQREHSQASTTTRTQERGTVSHMESPRGNHSPKAVSMELPSNQVSLQGQSSPVPSLIRQENTDCSTKIPNKSVPGQLQSAQKSTDSSEDILAAVSSSNPFTTKGSLSFASSISRVDSFSGFSASSISRVDSFSGYVPTYLKSTWDNHDSQTGARLIFCVGINDTIFIVRDDEPTSLIAYALMSSDYHARVSDKTADKKTTKEKDKDKESVDASSTDETVFFPPQILDSSGSDDSFTSVNKWIGVGDPYLQTKDMHVKVSFNDERAQLGKVKYSVICYYAKQFEELRKKCCPHEMDFIRSLSRCKKWGAQGGKSNVFFAKTLDDRFIIKEVTKTELHSFTKFAPDYFSYLSESLSTGSPTCLAKILGIYQVTIKKGGKETRIDVMAMENLLYGRNVTRVYDLKGSVRSRFNGDKGGRVLFDENILDLTPTNLIFVGKKAKRLLERAVWNDTSFLASIAVMDYSLLVGIDEERHELVLGIIDFMRQYTWDKHLETWVKASGILGGPKTPPTVISPKQYKKRFRKAMSMYFLVIPDQWSPSALQPSYFQGDMCSELAVSRHGEPAD